MVVSLSTRDNTKLLQNLKSKFKHIINCHKYQWKVSTLTRDKYLDYLIDAGFQGLSRLSALSFKDVALRIGNTGCIKVLQHYEQWKKLFWSASKMWSKNIW